MNELNRNFQWIKRYTKGQKNQSILTLTLSTEPCKLSIICGIFIWWNSAPGTAPKQRRIPIWGKWDRITRVIPRENIL